MKPVVIHEEAIAELDAAMAYYESEKRGLGLDLQAEVQTAVGKIGNHPAAFPPHKNSGFRKYFVGRFPYTVFFMELKEIIWVAAIAHQSRRPNYWRKRSLNV